VNRYDIALGKPLVITGRMRREQEDRQDSKEVKGSRRDRPKKGRFEVIDHGITTSLSIIGNLDWVAEQLEKSDYFDLAQTIDTVNDRLEVLERQKRQEKQKRFMARSRNTRSRFRNEEEKKIKNGRTI